MTTGYAGKILVINLTNRSTGVLDTEQYEEFGGGNGIGSAIFWDLCQDKAVSGFDPKNVVTVTTGPLSGTLTPGASRTEICGINVFTYPVEWFSRSNIGGFFGTMLKYAGWDGIVIEGKADKPVWIKGLGYCYDAHYLGDRDLSDCDSLVAAAQKAYSLAGITDPLKELDVAEISAEYSYQELLWYEGLGFCDRGEGGKLMDSGVTEMSGKLPVNPSGGVLSTNCIGATALLRVGEAALQIFGSAGKRQVQDVGQGADHLVHHHPPVFGVGPRPVLVNREIGVLGIVQPVQIRLDLVGRHGVHDAIHLLVDLQHVGLFESLAAQLPVQVLGILKDNQHPGGHIQ